jgi:plastocyanin
MEHLQTRSLLVATVAALFVIMLATGAVAITKTTRATSDDRWNPRRVDIGRGDRVRWSNPTGSTHNVRAWGGGWTFFEVLSPGEGARKTFRKRGKFKFRCTLHSTVSGGRCQGMCGLVTV